MPPPRSTRTATTFPYTTLSRAPDFRFQAEAIEAVDLLQAGRRGDVDFGHVVADDVDADKDEPAFLQGRADGLADLELAARQLGLLWPPAGVHVGARLASGRHAVDGAGRAAVDEHDALVAAAHLRQVALHDDGLAIEIGEQLQPGRASWRGRGG